MISHSIKTPTGPLEYSITHRSRVTRRLHLELDEQGGLVIVAPSHWSKAHIDATMALNTTHIARFLSRARQQQLRPLCYESGEQHLFLGESYQLYNGQARRNHANISISVNMINVYTRQATVDSTRVALRRWYREQASRVFDERLQLVAQDAKWAQSRPIPLKLRRMKRTWGNCSSAGLIKLNTHLVKAPMRLIDSVIAHELCHLVHMNHSRSFYALLEDLNPDWRNDRAVLRSSGFIYLRE